jgi:hypothetical protein
MVEVATGLVTYTNTNAPNNSIVKNGAKIKVLTVGCVPAGYFCLVFALLF